MNLAPILIGLLLLSSQKPAQSPEIGIAAVGQIAKIDKARRTFQVRTTHNDKPRLGVPADDDEFDFRIGVTIGAGNDADRSARPDPRSLPVGGISGASTPDEDSRAAAKVTITEVFLTDVTSCKDGTGVILCEDLKLTDNVRVTGNERRESRGKGLYATEVVRIR